MGVSAPAPETPATLLENPARGSEGPSKSPGPRAAEIPFPNFDIPDARGRPHRIGQQSGFGRTAGGDPGLPS